MTGQRYVSAWDNGLRNMGAHWIKEGARSKGDTLNSLMQMDHVIRVDDAGLVHDDVRGVYAPEINIGTAHDGFSVMDEHEQEFASDMARVGWSVEFGWSGQNSGRYSGPIMHDSEFIGGNLAEHIVATPGYWVACTASTQDESDSEGWVIMHHPATVETIDLLGRITRRKVTATCGVTFTVDWGNGATTTERYDRKGSDWREADEGDVHETIENKENK